MTVWLAGSRSAAAARIATVLPVPTSPVTMQIVLSATAPVVRAAASRQFRVQLRPCGAPASPPRRGGWFGERSAADAGRGRARVSRGESATAACFAAFPVFRFPPVARFPCGAVDEEPVGDLVAQGGVVAVAEGGQVVDPGRGGLGAGLPVGEAGLGVAVPADGERHRGPRPPPGAPDPPPAPAQQGEPPPAHPP